MSSQERESAVQWLNSALAEQNRSGERFDAAVGTTTEFGAYVRLQAAGEEVRARQAWVNWVDDRHSRGLGTGPFERLAESRKLAFTKGLDGRQP